MTCLEQEFMSTCRGDNGRLADSHFGIKHIPDLETLCGAEGWHIAGFLDTKGWNFKKNSLDIERSFSPKLSIIPWPCHTLRFCPLAQFWNKESKHHNLTANRDHNLKQTNREPSPNFKFFPCYSLNIQPHSGLILSDETNNFVPQLLFLFPVWKGTGMKICCI